MKHKRSNPYQGIPRMITYTNVKHVSCSTKKIPPSDQKNNDVPPKTMPLLMPACYDYTYQKNNESMTLFPTN
ncbi:hypothetical protein PRUPE_6G071700 [Prunus persica]|uniref:Uncharacterized protein n=1 Tax=Prunus persica TaxID=3760 RepID=A0A251NLI4_PRUPE|nr:hypothetical protein PRUPE_6G071700 [Prunus persica]